MRILLTGIGGFIGAHFLEHLLENTDAKIVGIASWRHKGVPERVLDSDLYQAHKDDVDIITHDLTAPFSQQTKDKIGSVDIIINMASESHVDRSIIDPVSFIQNNVNLVLNMLEFAREVKPRIFFQISTDEVYGVAPTGVNHKEWSEILPSNPYAASKAAQEAIAISYWRTYNVPVVITNTMNNFGERQDAEKFIPLIMRRVLDGKTINIHSYPNGKQAGSRFYLHARNHADAILHLMQVYGCSPVPLYTNGAKRPDRFNVVGEQEVDNLTMAQLIAEHIGRPLHYELVDFHSSRPGHDTRYALDGSALKALGWKPPVPFARSLQKTIDWTLRPENIKWLD